ncbi:MULTISPECIES: zinc ribbon domain-containing protein [Aquimarina]|uniref:zinc ribbon domain-containing protein n=1 Tax=Aquimarina TaxID=290174 RepID=UPI0009456D0A|nr:MULTISPECIES: zinc ribbon domain-containing protein [Aquimarina]
MNCKNCNQKLDLTMKFCPNCGQEKIDQFDASYLLKMIKEGLSFDKGFAYNLKSLFYSGGNTTNRFVSGKTRPFQNPILFYITTLGLLFLIVNLTQDLLNGDFFQILEDGKKEYIKINTRGPDTKQVRWLYFIITILIIPLYSIIFHLFRDYKKQSFIRSIIAALFLLSAINIIQSFVLLINRITFYFLVNSIGYYDSSSIGMLITFIFLIVYVTYFLYTYFTNKRIKKTVIVMVSTLLLIIVIIYIGESTKNVIEVRV